MSSTLQASSYPQSPAWGPHVRSAALVLALLIIAVLCGMLLGLGSKIFNVMLFACLGGVLVLLLPLEWVLGMLLVGTLVLTGLVQYFARFNQVQWLPSLFALALFLRIPLETFQSKQQVPPSHDTARTRWPPFLYAWSIFLLVLLATSIVNRTSGMQLVAGLKNYVAFGSIPLLLLYGSRLTPQAWQRTLTLLLGVALLQLPLAIYQHFFVATKRTFGATWDSVVGTFGGDPEAGGASGELAVFCVLSIVLMTALWRRRAMHPAICVSVALVATASVALAEVKIVVVLFPLAMLLLFGRSVLQNPLRLFGAAAAAGLFVLVVLTSYQSVYWSKSQSTSGESPLANFEQSIDYVINPSNYNVITGEVGRVAALALWANSSQHGAVSYLIGNGLGSSRISGVAIGKIARKYFPLNIGASALASMLWDIGVLGAGAFYAMLLLGALHAARLALNPLIPPFHAAVLDTAKVGLLLCVPLSTYNGGLLYLPAATFSMSLWLGHVAYWHAATRTAAPIAPRVSVHGTLTN